MAKKGLLPAAASMAYELGVISCRGKKWFNAGNTAQSLTAA